jgi:hypothetical protein
MLECRIVRSRLGMDQVTIKTNVVDKILTNLNSQEYEVFGLADLSVIMVRGKVDSVLSKGK